MEDFINDITKDAEMANAVDLAERQDNRNFSPEEKPVIGRGSDISENEDDLKFCNVKMYMAEQVQKVYCQDDSHEFKERLMRLVVKGQQEGLNVQRTQRNLLDQAKIDQEMHSKHFLQEASSSINKRLERPFVDPISPTQDDIRLMCIDLETYQDKPPIYLIKQGADPNQDVSIIRLFGVNEKGNSIIVNVYNFRPYFYIQVPVTMAISTEDLPAIKTILNQRLTNNFGVTDLEIVNRKSIMHYSDRTTKFLKVSCQLPKFVSQLRQHVEKGIAFGGSTFWTTTYESNMPHSLRFMIDNNMVGMSWLDVLHGSYGIRSRGQKKTTSQLELDVFDYKNIVFHSKCEGQFQKIAPLRLLSFDIECISEKGKFPTAENDSIIQIANLCQVFGTSEPFIRNVFTLNTCAPIIGTQVFSFQSEADLLLAWKEFVRLVDPDVITGYNIITFDVPYILARAQNLGLSTFPYLGRIKDIKTGFKETTFTSRVLGTRETKEINLEGRIQFDMLQFIIREHKLRSYTLNSVSAHFLGEQKEDVHYSIIAQLQEQDEYSRRRLAIYCIKDAYLPLHLMSHLQSLINTTEIARVCGIPLQYLFSRGQQIKVASQLYRKCKVLDYLIPTEARSQGSDGKFEGAVVLEPTRGYYTTPVAVLDFASLYPSIMMAHNLCYSTLIPAYKVKDFDVTKYERTPNGDYFVKKCLNIGVLPQILDDLIKARKNVKEQLNTAVTEEEKALLQGRQSALKVAANSVYGFTGAQVGQLPCLAISSSVTAYGRKMLEMTRSLVTEKFCRKNGYSADANVLYGDTDSVMISFGVKTLEQTIQLGTEAASYITTFFAEPISLVFEKCYNPFLLMNKKRYAGLLWTNPLKYDKIDCKGIETVRRDNCNLVKDVVNQVLDTILIQRSYEDAIAYCKRIISDLLQNRIDLSLLVITKGLGKKMKSDSGGSIEANTYQNKQAHTELAAKMKKRDAATAPSAGDRVAFVMIKMGKGARGYEKSEDPLYALEHNLPLDYNYYLENQLKQPLIRIFEPILQSPEQVLFVGDHTRNIYVQKMMNTGLGKYTIIQKACLSCKRVVKDGEAICAACKPKEQRIYIEKRIELNRYEKNYSDMWVQCQRCQESLHQEILCQNRDCTIFYRRVKAAKNLQECKDIVERFDIQW